MTFNQAPMPSTGPTINREITISNLEELEDLAKWLKKELKSPSLILLHGQLGTGKTALVKKLFKQYGISENQVKSPTFSLINLFVQGGLHLAHLDLYRLVAHDQFLLEEMREILSASNTVMLVEWPEKLDLRPIYPLVSQLITVDIEFDQNNFRKFQICVKNQHSIAQK